ncbi:hypothetical protein MGSAQ_002716 [marine sediment metagenome]|uniref:Uncharacterized protein n=1 Tax=marine sediment metagenome TaxID=412755 RepID=A0A1B6NR58_9ZZZZ
MALSRSFLVFGFMVWFPFGFGLSQLAYKSFKTAFA